MGYRSTTGKALEDLASRENENIRRQKMLEKSNESIKDIQDALDKLEREARQNSIADTEAGGSELDQWLGAARKLRNSLKYHPNYAIPEFKYLTAKECLFFTADGPLQCEADYRKALAGLRQDATLAVGNIFKQAVKDFSNANNGKAPTQLSDIVNYLPKDFDPRILERYETNASGETYAGADAKTALGGRHWIIKEAAPPVDSIWNSARWVSNIGEVGLKQTGLDTPSGAWAVDPVRNAIKNYAKEHGAEPASAGQIGKYIKADTINRAGEDKINEIFQTLMNK
ncbi:hypothetical protein AW736_22670 [Termitidicoccus mucosus]|uniref:Uncharacterized protein n=2 Tax=Termitidicoccus mucosus TaxID=1184151 RepID=A0A178IEJ4_9BACT|nr:hypothetical protein AW736_22670 [Opitutaceae bacterium TSB47]